MAFRKTDAVWGWTRRTALTNKSLRGLDGDGWLGYTSCCVHALLYLLDRSAVVTPKRWDQSQAMSSTAALT
jgi:hypothetical protein